MRFPPPTQWRSDPSTGRRMLVVSYDDIGIAPERQRAFEVAKRVELLAHPEVLPVRATGRELQYADPPARPQRAPMSPECAIGCALRLSCIVARLHAVGVYGISIAPTNLRWIPNGTRTPRLCMFVPPLEKGPEVEPESTPPEALSLVQEDLWRVVVFLAHQLSPINFGLVSWYDPLPPPSAFTATELTPTTAEVSPREEHLCAQLNAVLRGNLPPELTDAAALAKLLAPFAPNTEVETLDALPIVTSLSPIRTDWNLVIDELQLHFGSALHLEELQNPRSLYKARCGVLFAAALHQRACQHFAAGRLSEAIEDAQKATQYDPYIHYRATLAVLLEKAGQRARALEVIEVVAPTQREGYENGFSLYEQRPEELARAVYVLGVLRFRCGRSHAVLMLEHAVRLQPTAFYKQQLAALRRRVCAFAPQSDFSGIVRAVPS